MADDSIAPTLSEALHDMCQPLTALQCMLEIGQLKSTSGEPDVWAECLRECARLNEIVHAMHSLVQKAAMGMPQRETKG
jgi:hypothetical protein